MRKPLPASPTTLPSPKSAEAWIASTDPAERSKAYGMVDAMTPGDRALLWPKLVYAARHDPDRNAREFACRALAGHADDPESWELVRAIAREDSQEGRYGVARAIGYNPHWQFALPLLLELHASPHSRVTIEAYISLRRYGQHWKDRVGTTRREEMVRRLTAAEGGPWTLALAESLTTSAAAHPDPEGKAGVRALAELIRDVALAKASARQESLGSKARPRREPRL